MAEEDKILVTPDVEPILTYRSAGSTYGISSLNPMELDWTDSFINNTKHPLRGLEGLYEMMFDEFGTGGTVANLAEESPEMLYTPEELTEKWDMAGTDRYGRPNMAGYEEYEDEFKDLKYAIEARDVKRKLDIDIYRKRKMADSPLSSSFAGGIADPVNLVILSTTRGVSLGYQILANAYKVGLASIPVEIGRQYTDPTANKWESVNAIGMNMAFSVPFTLGIRGIKHIAGKIQNKGFDVDPNNIILKDIENQYEILGDYPTLKQAKQGEDFAFVLNANTENIPNLKTVQGMIKDKNGYAEYNPNTETITMSPKLLYDFNNKTQKLFAGHNNAAALPQFKTIREATEFFKIKAIIMKTKRYPIKKGENPVDYHNRINNAILSENDKLLNINFDPTVIDDGMIKAIAKYSNQLSPVGRILNTKFKNKEINALVKIYTHQTHGDHSISFNAMFEGSPLANPVRTKTTMDMQNFSIIQKNMDNSSYSLYRNPDYLTNTSEPLKQNQLLWNTKFIEYGDRFKNLINVRKVMNDSKIVQKGEDFISKAKGTRRTEADTKAFVNRITGKPYTQDEYMGLIYEDILTGKTTSPLPNSVKDATKFYKAIYADFRKELLDAGELISEAGLKKDIGHYQGALAEIQPITNKLKARKDKLGQEMYKMHLSFRNDIQYIIRTNQNMLKEFELGIRNELDVNPNYLPISYLPDQLRIKKDLFINKAVKELTKQRALGKPILDTNWRQLEKQGKPVFKTLSKDPKDIRATAENVYSRITRDADGNNMENASGFRYMANGERRPLMGAAQSRTDIIPQEWLMENGFLNTNISDLTQRYMKTGFTRLNNKERLGDAFGIAERFRIQAKMFDQEVKTAKDLKKADSVMEDLAGEMEKDYNVFFIGDPTSFTARTAHLVKNLMGPAYMGKAMAASLPDTGKLVLSNGFLPTYKAFLTHNPIKSFLGSGNRARLKGAIGKSESYNDLQQLMNDPAILTAIANRPNFAEAAQFAMHDAFASGARYMDAGNAVGVNAKAYIGIGKKGPTLSQKIGQTADDIGAFWHKVHKDYYLANGLTSWTQYMKNVSNIAGMDEMIRGGLRISKGKGSVLDYRIWKSMNLNKRDADFIKKMVDKGEIEESSGLMFAQRNNWLKYKYGNVASDKFALALYNHTERSIVTSHMTDKPNLAFGVIKFKNPVIVEKLFNNRMGQILGFSKRGKQWRMDNAIVGLMTQFMTHPIASMRKTVASSLSGRERNVVGGFMNLIIMGVLSQYVKNPRYFASLDPEEQLLRGIEASGAFGLWGDANFYIETLSVNKLGIRPLTGMPPKYGETDKYDATGMAFGAGPGAAIDTVRALTSDGYSEGKKRFVRNLPFANYPYLGRILKRGLYGHLYDLLRID